MHKVLSNISLNEIGMMDEDKQDIHRWVQEKQGLPGKMVQVSRFPRPASLAVLLTDLSAVQVTKKGITILIGFLQAQ